MKIKNYSGVAVNMYKSTLTAVCLFALTACGAGVDPGSGDGSGATDPDAIVIPDGLKESLASATYNPAGAGTLVLNMQSLDSPQVQAAYQRNPGLDIGPYRAFTLQNDPLDRHFTALVAQVGSVRAGTVSDGGQFNRYYRGGFYERDGGFTPPTVSGLVSYAGTYAGVTNVSAPGADLLPIPGPVDPSRAPRQSARVQGDIFLNVDFSNNAVNGNIIDRVLVDSGTALPNIVLVPADIAANGTFAGRTEYDDQTVNGDYGGIFGGTDAGAVGGIVALNSFDGPSDSLGFTEEEEHGTFVLIQCGMPGEAPICANVNP